MELLNKLAIDWKLLVAQIINFVILLALLYRFAYKPVLSMLEKRSKMIKKGVADAKESEEKLAQAHTIRDEKIAQAEREVGVLIESAHKDAEVMKKEIIEDARKTGEEMLERARVQMQSEKEKMLVSLHQEVAAIIIQATGKILQKEFSSADQKRLLDTLGKEMHSV